MSSRLRGSKFGNPGSFASTAAGAAATQKLQRGRVALWTREKIASLSTVELRQLRDNALRLGEPEIAALCDEVLGARPRRRVAAKA